MFNDPQARRFIIGVLIAFLPAMVIGALAYSIIKSVLFNVWIVCAMLIIGGFVLLWVDRLDLKPRYHDATKFSLPMYLGIGVVQCISMVPGVSRSGATIVGACCSAPTGARRRNSRSGWRCRPWSAPSPTKPTRAAPNSPAAATR